MLAIDQLACLQCGGCVALCPEDALFLFCEGLMCESEKCTLCGLCIRFCPTGAIDEDNSTPI
ncbi:MAG: 4Fe-4S binding protein [candidate division Zixibacteria bacterium]|nr:4Fe-4S binding protein [candidate division Zixibacteria bacterium]